MFNMKSLLKKPIQKRIEKIPKKKLIHFWKLFGVSNSWLGFEANKSLIWVQTIDFKISLNYFVKNKKNHFEV